MTSYPTDSFCLNGKVIVITGASSGIGASVAQSCARLGAKVVLTGRDAVRLQTVSSSLPGSLHQTVVGDLLDGATLEAIINSEESFDGLVSCAGIASLVPMRMSSQGYLKGLLDVNYVAPMDLTRLMIQSKKLRHGSSLVYVSALAARLAPQATGAYSASKAALEAAVRTIGLEHAKHRIRANCIAPGYVETPMLQKLSGTSNLTQKISLAPLGTLTPDDVAPAAVWLLSSASKWITRSTLTIDGGISLPIRS